MTVLDIEFKVALNAHVAGSLEILLGKDRTQRFIDRDCNLRIQIGTKFIKIIDTEGGEDRSVHHFVAITDSVTRGLGSVKRGDVMKSASWKTPARHARGNIFDTKNGNGSMGRYGPGYMR